MGKMKKTTVMKQAGEKQQIWGARLNAPPDELNVQFCAGRDVFPLPMADEVLLEYDIWTNLAHSNMLHRVGVLNSSEMKEIKSVLIALHEEFKSGDFQLDSSKEDVHINVEQFITHSKGISSGKKIHTGRSRNDQVATDMRLYLRDRLIELINGLLGLIDCILNRASSEKESLMPGFTHYQPAMLTTAGHWLTSWSQALLRDLKRLFHAIDILNRSPLGAAASFGTSWPIDREYTAELLGFDGVEENSLDCIGSRGENESGIASGISLMMNHLSTISQDIILLSTPYYNMLEVDDRFVTGSSIMPQKRNPDFAEVIKSKASMSHGILVSLLGIQTGAMSGYNRDSQQTKYLIMDLFRECTVVPSILSGVCASMKFNRKVMRQHCQTGFMNSADVADWMAQKFELSFRDCYEVLSLAVKYSEKEGRLTVEALKKSIKQRGLSLVITEEEVDFLNSPEAMIRKKTHTGGPSTESVGRMILSQEKKMGVFKEDYLRIKSQIKKARDRCFAP